MRFRFIPIILLSVCVFSCNEIAKKTHEKKEAEPASVSETYTKKFVPQLRIVFSILAKVMIIAERISGPSDGSKTAIGVLEDLSTETALGKSTQLRNGKTEYEMSAIFGRVVADKKADISFIVVGQETKDHFAIDSVSISVTDLYNGIRSGNPRVYKLITSSASTTEATTYKFEFGDLEKISKELHKLNNKIREFTIDGSIELQASESSAVIQSSGVKWKDSVFRYELENLKVKSDLDSNILNEAKVSVKIFDPKDEDRLFASLTLDSNKLSIADLDSTFKVYRKEK